MNASCLSIESVFGAAIEIDSPEERKTYLDAACRGDPAFRAEIDRLLQALEKAGTFMHRRLQGEITADAVCTAEQPGALIGPYNVMIDTLAFSPDGKQLAAAHDDRMVKLFDAKSGQELQAIKNAGWGVEFSRDGKQFATGGSIWDAKTGEKIRELKEVENFISLSPDGRHLAAGSNDRTLHIYDLEMGKEIRTFKGGARAVGYSPDGRRLASYRMQNSSDYTIKIWDVEKDQDSLTVERTTGYSVAISPDGRYMATGEKNLPSGDETNVRLWDLQTGQAALVLKGHTAVVHGVAFSPDGKRLASGGTGRVTPDGGTAHGPEDISEIKIWSIPDGKELLSIKGQRIGGYSLAFSPDGNRIASTQKVWNAETGEEVFSLDRPVRGRVASRFGGGYGRRVAFSPDAKYLATGAFARDTNEVVLWSAKTGEEVRSLQGGGQGVAFSRDGKRLASVVTQPDRKIWVWDVETGREIYTIKGGGYSIAFSPDGKRLASGGMVWDAETGEELLAINFRGYGTTFSRDGHLLISVNGGQAKIWDATPLPEVP